MHPKKPLINSFKLLVYAIKLNIDSVESLLH